MYQDPVPPADNTPFPYEDANAHPGRRNSAAPFCNEMVGVLHPSNTTLYAETTCRLAPPSMAATSIARARIRSMAVSIDNLHCRGEVFWSFLESPPLTGWLTISSCWVVRQHLAWFSVPLGLQVIHLRGPLWDLTLNGIAMASVCVSTSSGSVFSLPLLNTPHLCSP